MRYLKSMILPAMLCSSIVIAADNAPSTELDKLSYSLGVKTAENFKLQDININAQQFSQGLSDSMSKKKILLSDKEMQDVIVQFQNKQIAKITAQDKKIAAENMIKSKAFLEANKKKEKVVTLDSGLQYIVITPGKGLPPTRNDLVTVNYRGTLIDGTEFDSSYSRKEPSTFPVSGLIPGWQEALSLMPPGSKWKIFVPPNLAYGDKGAGRAIEPNSTLIFELELVKVQNK